ncbi:MAG: phage tail tape measure protein [Clostridia bacterium]|nr:phage tail tape measure protein [Clostridia bacterium]
MSVIKVGAKLVVDGEKEYKSALANVNAVLKNVQAQMKLVTAEYADNASSTEALRAKQEVLTRLLTEQGNKVSLISEHIEEWKEHQSQAKAEVTKLTNSLEEQQKKYDALKNSTSASSEEIEEQEKAVENAADALNKAQLQYEECSRKVKGFETSLVKAKTEVTETKNTLKDLGDASENAGKKAKKAGEDGFTVFKGALSNLGADIARETVTMLGEAIESVAKAIGDVFQTGIEFESAFTGVMKTVDETVTTTYADLAAGIRQLAQEIPATTTEISEVAEAAGQLGISADDVLTFTETMIALGESTNLTSTEAAENLAKFANITKMSSKQYANLGSAIVDLGNNFATTEADIVSMTTRLASTGEVVGLTESEMLAVATALSSVGIEAEAGGSAISKMMKKIETTNATYESSIALINKTGLSLRELQLMQSNNSKGFKELAGDLSVTTKELSAAMKAVDDMNKYAEVSGTSVEKFRKAYGESAVSGLSMFINGLSEVDAKGGSAVETLQNMGLTEIRLSNAILSLAASDDILGKTLETSNAAWLENTALTEEAGKRYGTLESQIEIIKNKLTETKLVLNDGLGEGLGNSISQISSALSDFSEGLSMMLSGENGAEGKIEKSISDMLNAVGSLASDILPKINEIIKALLSSLLTEIINALPQFTDLAFDLVFSFANTLVDSLPEIISTAPIMIESLCKALSENLPLLIPMAVRVIVEIATGLVSNVPLLIDSALLIVEGLIEGILMALPELYGVATELIIALVDSLIHYDWASVGSRIWSKIKSAWTGKETEVENDMKVNGSHANGLYSVPFDGYIAELHAAERVLTAQEAAAYNRGEYQSNEAVIRKLDVTQGQYASEMYALRQQMAEIASILKSGIPVNVDNTREIKRAVSGVA